MQIHQMLKANRGGAPVCMMEFLSILASHASFAPERPLCLSCCVAVSIAWSDCTRLSHVFHVLNDNAFSSPLRLAHAMGLVADNNTIQKFWCKTDIGLFKTTHAIISMGVKRLYLQSTCAMASWRLIEWMIDWLIDSLIDWLIDLLIDWLIDWLLDWLIAWLIAWLLAIA